MPTTGRVGEGLAGAGAGPDAWGAGVPGEAQGEGPAPDSGEEVALVVGGEVGGLDIGDAPGVDGSGREVTGRHQAAQPRDGEAVVVAVEHGGGVTYGCSVDQKFVGGRRRRKKISFLPPAPFESCASCQVGRNIVAVGRKIVA